MELNNIIFSFFLLIFGYFLNNYILLLLKKSNINLMADNDFQKPQAFHKKTTYRIGGITVFLLLLLSSVYLFFSKNIFFPEYVSFCSLFFLLGLLDDLKVNMSPKLRLGSMVFILLFLIIKNDFYIERTGLEFLNYLLSTDIFAIVFASLCFLFIINGSNLIDGFNGLLGIHALIIFIVLFAINLNYGNNDLAYLLYYIIIAILIFLKFNFPKSQMFLGDSGSYLVGALLAVSVGKTSTLNLSISPFFFCILLAYLFFEVFFSFFRKILFARQSPLLPDQNHLHMNFYKFLLKKSKSKKNLNYKVAIYINTTYLLLITPAFIFMHNGLFWRYYFFFLLLFYIYTYQFILKVNFKS